MSDKRIGTFFWSASLVVTGLLLILFNFGFLERFEPIAQFIVAACFAIIGMGFLGSYLTHRSMWWRLIPGWTFLSVAAMVLASTIPTINTLMIPAVLFLGLALAFGNIFLINRTENWWAIIPGGFMLVLSVVIWLNTVVSSLEVLFAISLIGMGLVFLLITLLGPTDVRWWPLIPGLVLVLFGLFILSGGDETESALMRWWPAALIVIGLITGWRGAVHTPSKETLSVNIAPVNKAPGDSTSASNVASSSMRMTQDDSSVLGAYSEPAPGASVEVIADYDVDEDGDDV